MSNSYESDRIDSDADKDYNAMMYMGKKIPSKTFQTLKQSMNGHTPTAQGNGELHKYRVRGRTRSEDEGIDISGDVVVKMDVGHASSEPHKCMGVLKEPTLAGSEVKVSRYYIVKRFKLKQ